MNPRAQRACIRCFVAVLPVVLSARHRVSASQALPGAATAICSIHDVTRSPIRLDDGREIYVEPQSLATAAGEMLLAGRPAYVWRRDGSGVARPIPGDRTIGVLMDERRSRLVEAPVSAPMLDDVSVVSLGAGRWAMLVSELDAESPFPERDGVVGLWYGELDGSGWSSVEAAPRPAGGRLQTFSSSGLHRGAGALGWLAQDVAPDGTGRILYFERRKGVWTTEVVAEVRADALALGSLRAAGLTVALAGPSEGANGWTYALRTLRGATWDVEDRVAGATEAVVRQPLFSGEGRSTALSWVLEPSSGQPGAPAAWAADVSPQGRFGRPYLVDPRAIQVVPIVAGEGRLLWVTDHTDVERSAHELRIVQHTSDGPAIVGTVPNPYTGYFAASWDDPEVVIVGPEFNPASGQATVRSLVIRVTLSC